MNIFALDRDPAQAAEYLSDIHIPKMAVETAQMFKRKLQSQLKQS